MKIFLVVSIALFFVITPVFGALSDSTGLVNRLDIQTGGHSFEVETVSNFEISNFEFDKDEKRLTLHIVSGLENNLGEVIIPQNLLGGNMTFYLNEQEYLPQINSNEKISFITLNFTGSGDNKLDIIATTYLAGLTEISSDIPDSDIPDSDIPEPDISPIRDYDYEMIYVLVIIIVLIIGGIVGIIVFTLKRKRK